MSVTELQIGDFVMYNGCFVRVYSIQSPLPRRDRLSDKSVITLFLNGLIDTSEDEIEPIPLTPEILEKNLEKECEDKIDGGLYFNAEDSKVWGILDEEGFWLNFNGQQDMILIHYAHELQRALRLCGLNELADNFKI